MEPNGPSPADRLAEAVRQIGPMVVAFSGGVDSALLAAAVARFAPNDSVAVTAESASLASGELALCEALAAEIGLDWFSATTTEFDDSRYLANDADRCYWCKTSLMDHLSPIADRRAATVVLGVNLDDLGEHRPGQQAAAEGGARFPLVEAKLTKAEIRQLAHDWGLPVWDRPSMPCLASRVPYGTPVTVPLLSRIDRAEAVLRSLGFDDVRVRHYGSTARIEVPAHQIEQIAAKAETIARLVGEAGYDYVTLDLAGLRSGNLNDALTPAPGRANP